MTVSGPALPGPAWQSSKPRASPRIVCKRNDQCLGFKCRFCSFALDILLSSTAKWLLQGKPAQPSSRRLGFPNIRMQNKRTDPGMDYNSSVLPGAIACLETLLSLDTSGLLRARRHASPRPRSKPGLHPIHGLRYSFSGVTQKQIWNNSD